MFFHFTGLSGCRKGGFQWISIRPAKFCTRNPLLNYQGEKMAIEALRVLMVLKHIYVFA